MIGKTFKSLFAGIVFLAAGACAGQAAAQAWTQLAPTGGPPAPRYYHSAVFNPFTDRMIVFGGYDGEVFDDVWVLVHADNVGGTPTWTQLETGGGEQFRSVQSKIQSVHRQIEIESETPPRFLHSAVYDVANNRMIAFAGAVFGNSCENVGNDVWVLSNADGTGGPAAWTQLDPANPPPARYWHSAVYDPATNEMIAFGGQANDCESDYNDVWVLSNANGLGGPPAWTQLVPTGTPPAVRASHSAIYNTATNRMVVFGGYNGGLMNDAWVLSNANGAGTPAWTQLSPTGTPPPARYVHTAVYDQASNRMVVFGGVTSSSYMNDTWVLSNADGTGGTPAWTQLNPMGTPPSGRFGHTAIYNPVHNRMVVFGGYDGSSFNDTWMLSDANGVNFAVGLDIQPGIAKNNFGLTQGTVVGVAILSSASFNAPTMVDTTTLTFGHTGTEASLMTCNIKAQDMNGDGLKDLICYFDVVKAGFQHGDTMGYLQGATTLDNGIHGSDMVKINP